MARREVRPSPQVARLGGARRHAELVCDGGGGEVDRMATEKGAPIDRSPECMGAAVTKIAQRCLAVHGRKADDALSEMVDFLSKGDP